ncbi:MAG: DUF3575 domain-containing protein [Flavobacteriales bacterium]|nr:DUF3575 domain-containing protein [Flavobacteriales bacterium]
MKLLLVHCSLLLPAIAFAQEPVSEVASALLGPRSVVKTNLVGIALLSVNANYEYKVGPSTSVGLLAGYKVESTFTLDAIGNIDEEELTYTGEISPKGTFVNPYFRFYPTGGLTGFYVEGFLRYYNYSYLVPYDYEKNGSTIRANLDGTADGVGGGVALGGQFALAPRLYLDLFAGLGIANGNMHVETNDPNLDAEDYAKIARTIEEYAATADVRISFLGNTLDGLVAGSNDNSAWADIEGELFPIVRTGVCIGWAF